MEEKCPRCNSSDLYFWREETVTKFYKLKEDGDYDNAKCVKSYDEGPNGCSGYKCKKCNCMWNELSGIIIN